jgi:hypothetical protein
MQIIKILVVSIFFASSLKAQKIELLTKQDKISLRGLSVVNDKIVWASGSNGAVARSTDGGRTFEWITVNDYEKRDFRDIEAFDKNTAVIMAVAEPAIILKTTDAGKTWKKVFEDSTKGMFLDAMDFDGNKGVVIGDPIDKKAFMAFTKDQGNSWQKIENDKGDILKNGEAFFAASGTNVKQLENDKILYVTGGNDSRLFYNQKLYALDIIKGEESTGANSVAVNLSLQHAVIVGGDFKWDTVSTRNCVLVKLGKEPVFSFPQTPPHGYRSCVNYLSNDTLIACGTSGVDVSTDGGMNWKLISKESFHVCQKAKKGNAVFLAGANGRISKLSL